MKTHDDDDEDEDECYEVGLASWLQDLKDDMTGKMFWPLDDRAAGALVRTEAKVEPDWPKYEVEVKRYYDTYQKARNACNGFVQYASAYETDTGRELGRGKRFKRVARPMSSSESEPDEVPSKKKVIKIATPPRPPPPPAVKIGGKDSKKITKIVKKGEKKTVSSASKCLRSSPLKNTLLQRIKQARQKATLKAEQKKSAMSIAFEKSCVQKAKSPLKTGKLPNKLQNAQTARSESKAPSPKKQPGPSKAGKSASPSRKVTSPKKFEKANVSQSKCPSQNLKKTETGKNTEQKNKSPLKKGKSPHKSGRAQEQPEFTTSTPDKSNVKKKDMGATLHSPVMSPKNLSFHINNLDSQNVSPLSADRSFNRLSDIEGDDSPKAEQSQSHVRSLFPTSPSAHKDIDHRLARLEKKQDDLSSKIDILIMNQAKMHRALAPNEARLSRPHHLPPLPIEDMAKLREFEKFLKDDANLSATCYYIQSFALPASEYKAVSKIMKRLITNQLATEFSFDGLGSKEAFKDLKLWEVVQGALLLKFPDTDLSEGTKSLRSWLRNAAGRK